MQYLPLTEKPVAFVHALLNALEMNKHGYQVKFIIEGPATALVKSLACDDGVFRNFYEEVKEKNIIDCVCRACASKMETTSSTEEQGLRLSGNMSGHPAMTEYIEQGYEIIVM